VGLFDFFKNNKPNSEKPTEDIKLDEKEIENLVTEIENVPFKEFWYGSKLLQRATHFKDERITKALTMRHYYLENKKVGSCSVLRHTIKTLEGPYFNTLWDTLQSGNIDQSNAASFILSEIGGLWTFQKILNLLRNKRQETYAYLIPCLIKLIARYYEIQNEQEPTMHDRELSNELFKFTTSDRIDEMIALLEKVPLEFFQDIDKNKLVTAIDNLRVQTQ